MREILYRLERVEKTYAGRAAPVLALTEPLTIERGEILVIVGPSGAGKSTLLRLLGLIEPPSEGVIEFCGAHLDNATPPSLVLRRRVVMVFQHPVLLNDSVYANVAHGLMIRGACQVEDKVLQVLAQVGLEKLARVSARTLSGGEAQRVALARALVVEPDVLLLDEPTANLDPYNVALIEQTIQASHRRQQTSFVVVTHNIFQARRLAERVGLLLNGRLIEVNTREEFFERPRDARTRAFVHGEMVY